MNGIGTEIAKNLILAGVRSVHLVDDALVTQGDECNYFVTEEQCGQNVSPSSFSILSLPCSFAVYAVLMIIPPKSGLFYFKKINHLVHLEGGRISRESSSTKSTSARDSKCDQFG